MKKLFLYRWIFLIGFLTSCSALENIPSTLDNLVNGDLITQTQVDFIPTEEINTPDPTQDWKKEEIEYGKERVYNLVNALEEYHANHSEYPTSLDDLIPDYITSIPKTIYGDQISYLLDDTFIFMLFFDLKRSGSKEWIIRCGYIGRGETWECSGYAP